MAGFSKSIQERFNKPWRPVVQVGHGKNITKKRKPEKLEIQLKFRTCTFFR